MTAVAGGNLEIVRLLLDSGADVNARETRLGQTALLYAAARGRTDLVKLLLEHHADIHAASNSGSTALEMAALDGHTDCLKTLIEAGSDVDHRRPDGLHCAMACDRAWA